jgi:hypothetical protein
MRMKGSANLPCLSALLAAAALVLSGCASQQYMGVSLKPGGADPAVQALAARASTGDKQAQQNSNYFSGKLPSDLERGKLASTTCENIAQQPEISLSQIVQCTNIREVQGHRYLQLNGVKTEIGFDISSDEGRCPMTELTEGIGCIGLYIRISINFDRTREPNGLSYKNFIQEIGENGRKLVAGPNSGDTCNNP